MISAYVFGFFASVALGFALTKDPAWGAVAYWFAWCAVIALVRNQERKPE